MARALHVQMLHSFGERYSGATGQTRVAPLGALALGLLVFSASTAPVAAQPTTADYEVVFEATWSAATHPVSFPPNPHFSPLVGALHDASIAFWEPGFLASAGIESMAESGAVSTLATEIDAEVLGGTAGGALFGDGIPSPGQTTLAFTAQQNFPELSLVSMLAPSPDWFVGVHNVPLFDQGAWVNEIVVDLFVYDAGTDNGASYESSDDDANPASPIALQGAPLEVGVPIGTFTIRQVPEPGSGLAFVFSIPLVRWLARRRMEAGGR